MRGSWRTVFVSICLVSAPFGAAIAQESTGKPAAWRAASDQGMSLFREQKLPEAEAALKKALTMVQTDVGPDDPNTARVLNQLAYVESAQGKYDEAVPHFQRAAAIVERKLGKDDANLSTIFRGLAIVYTAEGKYAEAEPLFQRALTIAEKSYGASHKNVAAIQSGYAELLRRMGKTEDAARMDARAQAITGKPSVDEKSPETTPAPKAASSDRDYDARVAYAKHDYATALKLFQELAGEGDPRAQAALGDLYMHGEGVKADPVEAAAWYRKSAEQGFAGAQLNLGVCYEKGAGVPKDLAEAVKWFRKAADQGDARGQKFVGDMYAKGLGVPKDWKEAERWYARAAEGGDREAANLMKIPDSKRQEAYESAQKSGKNSAMDLALRAVELQDQIGMLEWAVPKGVRVTLGKQEVTSENGKEVLARLKAERDALDRTIEQAGTKAVAGDYALTEPSKDKCKYFGQRQLQYPVKVTIVQAKNAIEMKGQELYGCGVVVGNLVVMKDQNCGGTSPDRILAVASDEGVKDLTFLEGSGSCKLGDLTRVAASK